LAVPLTPPHGTPVCRGTLVGNHCARVSSSSPIRYRALTSTILDIFGTKRYQLSGQGPWPDNETPLYLDVIIFNDSFYSTLNYMFDKNLTLFFEIQLQIKCYIWKYLLYPSANLKLFKKRTIILWHNFFLSQSLSCLDLKQSF